MLIRCTQYLLDLLTFIFSINFRFHKFNNFPTQDTPTFLIIQQLSVYALQQHLMFNKVNKLGLGY